jgi:hypothetical protein
MAAITWSIFVNYLRAQPSSSLEYEIKAAMLYNFAKFVEWPPAARTDAQAPIVVGVLGQDPFGAVLDDTMRDKSVYGRSILVRRFRTLADLDPCHVLFISRSERKRVPEILRSLQKSSVLTVSDAERFAGLGGIIGFTLRGNRIRFEINNDAARRAGLKISSKLLRLAKVRPGGSSRERN